jgi:hypothetical protein
MDHFLGVIPVAFDARPFHLPLEAGRRVASFEYEMAENTAHEPYKTASAWATL